MSGSREIVEVAELMFIDETPKAILVESEGRRAWVPRSQITYLFKFPRTQAGQEMKIKIPAWLADEKGFKY